MNRKQLVDLERTLANIGSEKISKIVTVKFPFSLWNYLKKLHNNVSTFIRNSVVQVLQKQLDEADE